LYAAEKGHVDIVKILAEMGADVNAIGNQCVDNDVVVGSYLLSDLYGWMALLYAAEKGLVDIVKILVEKGADINAKGNQCVDSDFVIG
jgi:ankyrin repeat protein